MTGDRRAVVVGIGNDWRSDDAVGLVVARELRESHSGETPVHEQDGDVNALLDALAKTDLALIVDSTASGAEPGTIRRLIVGSDGLQDALPRTSSHAFDLADALELARALDQLPAEVIIYGIEGENFAIGTGLSPRIARAADEVVATIRMELSGRTQAA